MTLDANKRGPLRQLLQLPGSHIRARRPYASQQSVDAIVRDAPSVGHQHTFPLRGPIVLDSAAMFVHRHFRAHSVKLLELLARFGVLHQIPSALVESTEHP